MWDTGVSCSGDHSGKRPWENGGLVGAGHPDLRDVGRVSYVQYIDYGSVFSLTELGKIFVDSP